MSEKQLTDVERSLCFFQLIVETKNLHNTIELENSKKGITSIMSTQERTAALNDVIVEYKYLINPKSGVTTALHLAVRTKDRTITCLLLKNGANPEACDEEGRTPSYYAEANGAGFYNMFCDQVKKTSRK